MSGIVPNTRTATDRRFKWLSWSGRRPKIPHPNKVNFAGKITYHLLENVWYRPGIHEWLLTDVLNGGVGLTDGPKYPSLNKVRLPVNYMPPTRECPAQSKMH